MEKDFCTDRYVVTEKEKASIRARGLDPENQDDVHEYARFMRIANMRANMKERYSFGWHVMRPEYVEVSREVEVSYVRPPTITWWVRFQWRLWRWAKRRLA